MREFARMPLVVRFQHRSTAATISPYRVHHGVACHRTNGHLLHVLVDEPITVLASPHAEGNRYVADSKPK